jgi:hypothetical protein
MTGFCAAMTSPQLALGEQGMRECPEGVRNIAGTPKVSVFGAGAAC